MKKEARKNAMANWSVLAKVGSKIPKRTVILRHLHLLKKPRACYDRS